MIIGIDARMLGAEQGGLGRYTEELLRHLEKIDQKNDYVIFLRRQNWNVFTPSQQNFRKVLADIKWYGFKEQWQFLKIINRQKIDLMHYPHWNVPFFYNRPFVLTLHDLILLRFPDRHASTHSWLLYKLKYLFFKIILRHAIFSAKKILVPSKFVKNDLLTNFKIDAQKITVTKEGAPTLLSQTPTQILTQPNDDIQKKFNINQKYFLYVGSAYPHKNLSGLLQIFKIFNKKHSGDYSLVLSGKKNFFYERLKKEALEQKIFNAIFTDFVEDKDLANLYRNASIFIFPSLYEGFGLPPLEAMAYGVPVLAAKTSCLPEILGSAALFFDPLQKNEAADALWAIANDQILREKLIFLGAEQIKQYSWLTCAQLTLQAYQNGV